jgi:predicted esterase
MQSSAEKIHGIIKEQIDKGISSERIVLGGFSQGGAIALLVCPRIHVKSTSITYNLSRLGWPLVRT